MAAVTAPLLAEQSLSQAFQSRSQRRSISQHCQQAASTSIAVLTTLKMDFADVTPFDPLTANMRPEMETYIRHADGVAIPGWIKWAGTSLRARRLVAEMCYR